jgi:hypothetical protein
MKGTNMYETIWKAAAQITVPCPRMKSKTFHRFCCLGLAVGWAVIGGIETEARAAAGATTPFVTLEAEAGTLGVGAIIRSITPGMPVPTVATLELEASGHSLVELRNNGDSVSWVNNTGVTANAVVIRASIPDAPNGGGITATINLYVDGVFRQEITLSSKQSWVYRGSLTNPDDPNGGGMPYHFYNEDRVRITSNFRGTPPIQQRSTTSIALISRTSLLR